MKGYSVPEHVWRAATDVPCEIANDESKSVADRLKAVSTLHTFIRDSWEIRIQLLEQEAAGLGADLPDPVVREDENFFGNHAHETIKQQGPECR